MGNKLENYFSYLATDAYKYAMAEAGFPLREETFYFSFRKGGWHYNPYDLQAYVKDIVKGIYDSLNFARGGAHDILNNLNYTISEAMVTALLGEVKVNCIPQNQWFYEREPILAVTGPSFLLSHIEPLILQLHFPIQVATAFIKEQISMEKFPLPWGRDPFPASCGKEKEIFDKIASETRSTYNKCQVLEQEYADRVRNQAKNLKKIVHPSRVFEVGLRAATCMEQHMLACKILKGEGIMRTSNMQAAHQLKMTPVGTMGHEHIQRWGSDIQAYRAMRDMRTQSPSYLLDTFDTISSGIPSAIKVIKEKFHNCTVRYDSGDKRAQYMYAIGEFKKHGLEPGHIIEDGLTLEETKVFEELRKITKLDESKQLYGYGGYFISHSWKHCLSRDNVSAVYKLAQTSSEPRMKFGNESGLGKQSVPGLPVVWRKLRGEGPLSIIGQKNENVPENYACISSEEKDKNIVEQMHYANVNLEIKQNLCSNSKSEYNLSPKTQELIATFERK